MQSNGKRSGSDQDWKSNHLPAELEDVTLSYLRNRNRPEWRPFSTGLAELDDAIGGGFLRGEMVVLGGRPSEGKTAFALQLVAGISKREPCMVFSAEMSAQVLGKRVAHEIFGSPIPKDLDTSPGKLPDEWYERWSERESVLTFEGPNDIDKICRLAIDWCNEGERRQPRVIVVDYLQLLKSKEGKGRYEKITEVSMKLRFLTNHLKTTTIVCAQLARPSKTSKQDEPSLSDLKDSGQIEQDADVVLLLRWPWMQDHTKVRHEYHVHVAKNRNRGTSKRRVFLAFDDAQQRFMTTRDWELRADPAREGNP